ncbi:MAG: hypothetical protein QXY50_02860 [Candidatus Caldarchaeum sp.]
MDKSDIQMLVILFVFMVAMTLSTFIPKPWDTVVVFGAYFALIGLMVMADWALQVRLSRYIALEAIIIPSMTKHTFIVKDFETVARSGQVFTTKLLLAYPYNDPEGGRTNMVFIHHYGPLRKRLGFKPSRIRFSGRTLEHPQAEVCHLVRDPKGYVYHAKLFPVFHLYSSAKDAESYYRTYISHAEEVRHV